MYVEQTLNSVAIRYSSNKDVLVRFNSLIYISGSTQNAPPQNLPGRSPGHPGLPYMPVGVNSYNPPNLQATSPKSAPAFQTPPLNLQAPQQPYQYMGQSQNLPPTSAVLQPPHIPQSQVNKSTVHFKVAFKTLKI